MLQFYMYNYATRLYVCIIMLLFICVIMLLICMYNYATQIYSLVWPHPSLGGGRVW